jgi:prepilin-type N-terminal cleavage/methylation domain-containing protein
MRSRRRRGQRGLTLVELLVAMLIMGILTTMIIGSWVTLTKAYSSTSKSNRQRDFATQAIARMAREIRDAQRPATSATAAFVRAYPNEIRFYSTFNTTDADNPVTTPRLTRYILKETDPTTHVGAVYREFPGPDGLFDTGDDLSYLVVADVVNLRTGDDLFTYYAIDTDTGEMYGSDGMTTLVPADRVQTVGILLQVDLNPGKSPNYMDIKTTVEPRNVRHM